MKHRISTALLVGAVAAIAAHVVGAETTDVSAKLNGLDIVLDGRTGAIRRLEFPGPGTFLEADSAEAGLVDAAYPIEQFEPLRLSARYSSGASIEKTADCVLIRIPHLGGSRPNFALEGDVSATVTLRADADGRSVIFSCEMANNSNRPGAPGGFSGTAGPCAGGRRRPDHSQVVRVRLGTLPRVVCPGAGSVVCREQFHGGAQVGRDVRIRCGRDGWTWGAGTEASVSFRAAGDGIRRRPPWSNCGKVPEGSGCCLSMPRRSSPAKSGRAANGY